MPMLDGLAAIVNCFVVQEVEEAFEKKFRGSAIGKEKSGDGKRVGRNVERRVAVWGFLEEVFPFVAKWRALTMR